jgi:hypothetical protein
MPHKLPCPFCGRTLSFPDHPGMMICDGCEESFDFGAIRYRPASLLRRAIGMVAILVGAGLAAVPLFAAIALSGVARGDYLAFLGIRLIWPLILFAFGVSLQKGKYVLDRTGSKSPGDFPKFEDILPEL